MTNPEPAEGGHLGRYELVRPLGRGGMGQVWEAVLNGPQGFRKPVALKLIQHGHTSDEAAHRLAAEARLGALLQHPNVVGTLDLGMLDQRWYVAMELVRGASAAELLRAGPFPGPALLQLGQQVCSALIHVHALEVDGSLAGLVHRDVKPSNLLIDRTGLAKLADLGIARLQGSSDVPAGTPGYMSPEQVEGREDARADLFALGVTLLALATGRPVFGRGHEALIGVQRTEMRLRERGFLEPLDALVPGLGEVVRRCLRLSREDRFATAAELARALAELRAKPGAGLLELLAKARPGLTTDAPTTPLQNSSSGSTTGDAPTVVHVKGNLPRPRDRYVGRDDDQAALARRIRDRQSPITLHGLGGAGKTRLSLEAARLTAGELPGGAWFVDLSEVRDPAAMCVAVAGALGIKATGSEPIGAVGEAIGRMGRCLLILDNLEQVAGPAAGVVSRWSTMAPAATLLCTSRIALRIAGEVRVAVGSLPPVEAALLLSERAGRALTAQEQAAVPDLVAALEGLPLPIELAAARLRVLDVPEVKRRLTDRLRLLSGGDRDRPERQRSLRASLEGSWELLSECARSALAQLSVFEGGFTLETAEAVVDVSPFPDAPWAIDLVTELVDASVLRCDPASRRFSMLVMVQEFAASKLPAAERDHAWVRHGAVMSQYGETEALEAVFRRGAQARLDMLLGDRDNLVVATRRAIARGDGTVATRCCQAATVSFQLRGPLEAGIALALEVLPLASLTDDERVSLEHDLGYAHAISGKSTEGAAILRSALDRARGAGLWRHVSLILVNLSTRQRDAMDDDGAESSLIEALEVARRVGSRRLEGIAGDMLGVMYCGIGRMDEALALQLAAVQVFREIGNRRSEGVALSHLGTTHQALGAWEQARRAQQSALDIHREVGNLRSQAHAVTQLASLDWVRGSLVKADGAYAEAQAFARTIGFPTLQADIAICRSTIALSQGQSEQARELAHDALPLVHADAAGPRGHRLLILLALAAHTLGESPEPWLDDAERRTPNDPRVRRATARARGMFALERGEAERAVTLLREAQHPPDAPSRDEGELRLSALWLALAQARAGDPATATPLAHAALEKLRRLGDLTLVAEGLALASAVEAASGHSDAARATREESLALCDVLGLGPRAPIRALLARYGS